VSEDAQAVFDAIASPIRREILWLTRADELSAGEIGEHFDKSAATLSSHLAVLRSAGLVTMRVDGNFRRYRCNAAAVDALVPLLASDDERWVSADDIPEVGRAHARRHLAVVVQVDVPVSPLDAFAGFVESDRYEQWLGVPVTIRDGRFRATMEWGTEIRGNYEVVSPPSLIAMKWDFDDAAVPIPGHELVAYLRIEPAGSASRVTVHQLAADDRQATFLEAAWSVVLGRFVAAHDPGAVLGPRQRRGKRAPK
jgi:DNA-binding transcriptional ArsR family regulator